MTEQTRADLKAQIAANMPDNNEGLVSVNDSRTNQEDQADSAVFPEDSTSSIFNNGSSLLDIVNDGLLSINGSDASKFDVSGGTIRFSDAYTDADNPTMNESTFGPFSSQTLTNLATDSLTFIYINTSAAIVQETTLRGGDFLRDNVALGVIFHEGHSVIEAVSQTVQTDLTNINMFPSDLSFCQGPISCVQGDQSLITGTSGAMTLNKAQGSWLFHAINSRNDPKNPNIIDNAALVAPTLLTGWTVTDNPEGVLVLAAAVTGAVYDDGTAVVADGAPQGSMTTNQWVNHRVFAVISTNQLFVQYGKVLYASEAAAVLGVSTENFAPIPAAAATPPIATLTLRGGATETLSGGGDASIRQAIPPRATFQ